MQEVEHAYGQEMKHVQIGVEMPGKQVATSSHFHAVIPCVGMTASEGMVMIQNESIWRPRTGVG